jgi:hypothetical protein
MVAVGVLCLANPARFRHTPKSRQTATVFTQMPMDTLHEYPLAFVLSAFIEEKL